MPNNSPVQIRVVDKMLRFYTLGRRDNFLEKSINHFCREYLGSIKHEALVWSQTHAVE